MPDKNCITWVASWTLRSSSFNLGDPETTCSVHHVEIMIKKKYYIEQKGIKKMAVKLIS